MPLLFSCRKQIKKGKEKVTAVAAAENHFWTFDNKQSLLENKATQIGGFCNPAQLVPGFTRLEMWYSWQNHVWHCVGYNNLWGKLFDRAFFLCFLSGQPVGVLGRWSFHWPAEPQSPLPAWESSVESPSEHFSRSGCLRPTPSAPKRDPVGWPSSLPRPTAPHYPLPV